MDESLGDVYNALHTMTRRFVLLQAAILCLSCVHSVGGERQYSNVTLQCSGEPVDERVIVVEWFRTLQGSDREDLIANMMKNRDPWVPDTARFRADPKTYSVTLLEALVSDTGLYKCKGTISNGTDVQEVVNHEVQLTITDVPSKPPGKPEVESLGSDSVQVSWAFSLQDNNSPIEVYSIKIRHADAESWEQARQENVRGNVNQTVIRDLVPYTGYQVTVLAYNMDGFSEMGEPSDVVYTDEALPTSKPKIDDSKIIKRNTSIEIHFRPPKLGINGVLTGYTFKYRPDSNKDWRESISYQPNKTNHTFHNLKPFTHYLISVQINNKAGAGPAEERVLQTDEGVPSSPDVYDVRNKTHNSVTIYWYPPKEMNGNLVGYKIYWTRDEITLSKTIPTTELRRDMNHTINYLQPKVQYQFQVAAMTGKGTGAKSNTFRVYTDTIGPSAPSISNITWSSATSFMVQWTRPEEVYGQINYYLVQFRPPHTSHFKHEEYSRPDSNDLLHLKMTISDVDPKSVYYVQVAGATKSMFYSKYHVGKFSNLTETWCSSDILCKEEKLGNAEKNISKDPAKSVQGRVEEKHSPMSIVGVLLGIAATLIVLIAGLILFLLRRKYGPFQYWFVRDPENAYTVAPPDNTIPETKSIEAIAIIDRRSIIHVAEHEAVPLCKWADHVETLHADADIGFSQEFDAINQSTGQIPALAATDIDNKFKNRYINIVAYDNSRVRLRNPAGRVKNGDYINANYVDGYQKPNAYIAAQGPLPTTFGDFWRMVWEQGSEVIVMITNLIERGKRKCDQYWPQEVQEGEHQYGFMSVKWIKTWTTAHYTIRKFLLRNTKIKKKNLSEREVLQFHFTDWPDHGVPNYHLPVLDFIYKSSVASHKMAGPPIIHCSAGVGRTGTYIVLDTMIRQIEDQKTVNVYQFLSHIRTQRNFLVQTEDQYIFIHDALKEYIAIGGQTDVPKEDLSKYVKHMEAGDNSDTSWPSLDKMFSLITSHRPQDFEHTAAILPCNLDKNRSKDKLPVILSRVKLPVKPGVEGSDYINASYIQGFNHIEEYIVTQHPSRATIGDFWRMVWDQNTMTVVLLSQLDQTDYVKFWPEKGETEDYGNFKLRFTEETHELSHISRDFLLLSTQDDYECTVRVIATSYWPESCSPMSQAFELIHTVRSWHDNNEQALEGPIVVVDRFGGVEAGMFCALSTLYDQMRIREAIDIYMIAKLYHLKRPGIFEKKEDILFLLKAIESIADDLTECGQEDYALENHVHQSSTVPKLSSRSFREADRDETTI